MIITNICQFSNSYGCSLLFFEGDVFFCSCQGIGQSLLAFGACLLMICEGALQCKLPSAEADLAKSRVTIHRRIIDCVGWVIRLIQRSRGAGIPRIEAVEMRYLCTWFRLLSQLFPSYPHHVRPSFPSKHQLYTMTSVSSPYLRADKLSGATFHPMLL